MSAPQQGQTTARLAFIVAMAPASTTPVLQQLGHTTSLAGRTGGRGGSAQALVPGLGLQYLPLPPPSLHADSWYFRVHSAAAGQLLGSCRAAHLMVPCISTVLPSVLRSQCQVSIPTTCTPPRTHSEQQRQPAAAQSLSLQPTPHGPPADARPQLLGSRRLPWAALPAMLRPTGQCGAMNGRLPHACTPLLAAPGGTRSSSRHHLGQAMGAGAAAGTTLARPSMLRV